MEKNKFTEIYEKNIKNNFKNENLKFKKRKINLKDSNPYRIGEISTSNKIKDDSTKYGEFVPSFFNWMTLDERKKRSDELNNMTKD